MKPPNRIPHMLATMIVVAVAAMVIGTAISGISSTSGDDQEQTDISVGADSPPIMMSIVNNDLSISYHNPSQEDLAGLKSVWGVRDEGSTYNVLTDSMGTGLAPPASSEWDALSSSIKLVDSVSSLGSIPSSVDISTEPYFPKVTSQGLQGSCAAWAITYYAYGYLEAKDNGWTGASTGNPAHLISPAWTYNRANGGTDSGSSIIRNANIIEEWGVATLATMPYSDTDYSSWGSESAMREAPLHRSVDFFTMNFNGDATVEDVKELLASGIPVTIAFDANMYQPGFADGNWKISSLEYASSYINHAQTIVGYDDYVSEDGEVGAFRIVNSWGANFADSGYYWLTYGAFKEIGNLLSPGYFTDSSDYQPRLLATWKFSQSPTRDADITFDISSNGLQRDSKQLYYAMNSGGSTLRFPSFMCLDITEFNDDLLAGANQFSMTVGSSTYSGQVSSFKVEKYNGYIPGNPDDVSTLPGNVPAYTPCELTTSFASSGPTVPGSPRNLQALAGDSRVTLSWSAPLDDGGSSVTQYRIYRGTSSYSLYLISSVTSLSYTDSSVTNGNTYYYAVSAVNSVGEGPRSSQASAKPEASSGSDVPSVPLNIAGVPGDNTVILSWSPPADDGGSQITGYKIYRRNEGASWSYVYTIGVQTSYTFSGLTNGATYLFSVCAKNDLGYGPTSGEITVVPGASASTVPGAPTSLSAIAGDSRVTLSWSAPLDDGGSSVTQYRIYRGTSSYSLYLISSVTSLSYTDSSVTNGNTYYYAVSAVNSVGEGPRSSQVSAKPQSQTSVPGTPIGLTALSGDSKITLSWQAPANDGGSPITGYRVYRGYSSSSLSFVASVSSTQFQNTGLTNGLTYYYSVSAVNSVGEGSRCTAVSATPTTATSPPSAPLGLNADAGNKRVDLSWSAPADNGGSYITSYKVYRGTSYSYQSFLTTVYSASYADVSVSNGVTYYYSVSAVNSAGEGARSSVTWATPQEPAEKTVPSVPLNIAGVPGDSTVVLSWSPPADDGGSQITGYKIYRRNEGASWSYVYTVGVQTSYTFSGLTNGATYLFSVCAKNDLGYGPTSGEITVTPGGGISVPSSPQNLNAVGGNGKVTLSWQTPSNDGGSSITSYKVYRGTYSSTQSFIAQVSGLGYVDSSVVNGQTYYYRITAVNLAGEGPSSSTISVTPQATIEKPSAPLSLSASSGDGVISLTWYKPADDGGSSITGYRVYRGTYSSYMPLFTTLSGTSLTDSSVTNDVTYYYKVSAVNAVGEGDLTGTVSATPRSSSEVTVPGKPLNLWTEAGTQSVILHWSPPADDGGSQITGYKIYRMMEGQSWYYVFTVGNVNQYTFSNLYGGQTYYFSVSAANDVGYGSRSNEVSATPTLSALSESSISETPEPLALQILPDTPSLAPLVAKTGIVSADLQLDPLLGRITQ